MLASLLLATACQPAAKDESPQRPLILTSIYPYELLVQQFVGDAIEVKSLIPPGASVHGFSPQPSDLKNLNRADLVISNGMGLEAPFAQSLKQLGDKELLVSNLLRDMIALDSLKQVRDQLIHAHEEDGHQHLGADPHLWTSANMMLKLSGKLKNELAERFPDYAPLINHNYLIIRQELTDLHEEILHERAGFQDPAILTYHNSFHYFCSDYGVKAVGWVQSSPGKEPGARELTELGRKIQEHRVKVIVIEPQQNPKSAEVLAREYNLELQMLDPLGSTLEADTIAEVIRKNWESMKLAF